MYIGKKLVVGNLRLPLFTKYRYYKRSRFIDLPDISCTYVLLNRDFWVLHVGETQSMRDRPKNPIASYTSEAAYVAILHQPNSTKHQRMLDEKKFKKYFGMPHKGTAGWSGTVKGEIVPAKIEHRTKIVPAYNCK